MVTTSVTTWWGAGYFLADFPDWRETLERLDEVGDPGLDDLVTDLVGERVSLDLLSLL